MGQSFVQRLFRQVNRVLQLSGYAIRPLQSPAPVQLSAKIRHSLFLAKVLEQLHVFFAEELFFVQIGANDGKSNDPIHDFIKRYKPAGILIEPLPDIFTKLQETYSAPENEKLSFMNTAITNDGHDVQIHRIAKSFEDTYRRIYKPTANPSGISSIDRNHVKNFLKKVAPEYFQANDVENCIDTITVPGITMEVLGRDFIRRHVHFIQIDTEGYDGEIVRMILSTDTLNPEVICYEHKALTKEDRNSCEVGLAMAGHSLFHLGGDTCAVRGLAPVKPVE